jgi:long-chain-fatty-acid--CoA ligase ACSBG
MSDKQVELRINVKDEEDSQESDLLFGENSLWTSDPRVEIKRDVTDNIEPTTLKKVLEETVNKWGNMPAYTYQTGNVQVTKTWAQFSQDITNFARALIHHDLDEYSSVMIQGFNSYEWAVSHFATIMAGGISSGVYTSNLPEICNYMIDDCNAQIIIVENLKQLNKYKDMVNKLVPKIKAFIMWSEYDQLDAHWSESAIPVYSWWSFIKKGQSPDIEQKLNERMDKLTPWRCHSLIYTSGTTGYPKGVMISHDNVCWVASSVVRDFELSTGERIVSYLPLSHIAAQALDFYLPMFTGSHVTFARPDALKGSLKDTLVSVRPTIFFGVPRVWEKFNEKMVSIGAHSGCLKKAIGKKAKKIGKLATIARENKTELPYWYNLADYIVFNNVKIGLGLDAVKIFMTGAAPISDKVLDYFASLDIPVMNLYGASECCGPATFNLPTNFRMYMRNVPGYSQKRISCGKAFEGEQVIIDCPNETQNGEIIIKGRHVFMGYINKREKTSETIDQNGFYHTGDVGYMDKDGFLTITGRIKELLITRGGENVAPVLIENNIKKELGDVISDVVVIGDNEKFLTCLITLRVNIVDEMPTQEIDDLVQFNLFKKEGIDVKMIEDAINNKRFNKYIEDGIKKANKKAVSNAQTVKKFAILQNNFTVPGGELTPTLKKKRPIINRKNQTVIDELYGR